MKIHLIGIGGVGMAGLAVLLKRRGHAVTGCDVRASARTRWLEREGIPVAIGHDASHVAGQDLVIVTPAIAPDNPEYRAIGRGGVPPPPARCLPRGTVLARLVSAAPDSIAVCGSHGKTTTATFIAKLLIALGENVEWAIGGETGAFPVAGQSNNPTIQQSTNSPVLVVEADESDGTLAEYAAKTLVVTNCDYDHPDHFKTRADYLACYDAARAKAGTVVEAAGRAVAPRPPRARDEKLETRAETLDARQETSRLASLVSCPPLSALAPHNRANARLAIEVALRRGHDAAAIAAVLPAVVSELPDRRFQRVWPAGEGARRETRDAAGRAVAPRPPRARDEKLETRTETLDARQETSRLASHVSRPQPLVYTDYAHHPTEMRAAIAQARAVASGRVIVLFQPHRHSRTKALVNEFPSAFACADEVVLCPTYAAFEKPVEGGDVADLYAACRSWCSSANCTHGDAASPTAPRFYLARSCEEAWEHARNVMRPGDLTLLLGAGDIIDLVPQVQSDLRHVSDEGLTFIGHMSDAGRGTRDMRKIWIGAGSNTWKSDLALDVEYVKTKGPAGRPGAALLADPAIGPRIPWMAGIPGTIGGWVKMNAGAFGHSISEVIAEVKVDGKWIAAEQCGFSYRHSDISGEIQDVRWRGGEVERWRGGEVERWRGGVVEDAAFYLARRKKFPPGTKGSVFKNPPGDFAGRLLEAAGVKGLRVGGAYVWEEHANVIVAGPGATASDFLALARIMAARVRFRSGVRLEPEVAGLEVGE